jgi:hypothetical protein
MAALDFIAEFKALHEKAKNKTLTPAEKARYQAARMQLAGLVTIAQQLGHAGRTLRSSLRMAKMLKVEIRPNEGEPIKSATIDLASGGFAILCPTAMKIGASAAFTLSLPNPSGGGTSPMTGRASVASSRAQGGLFRVSFKFEPLHPDAQEQLDMALIDAVLERFAQR